MPFNHTHVYLKYCYLQLKQCNFGFNLRVAFICLQHYIKRWNIGLPFVNIKYYKIVFCALNSILPDNNSLFFLL